MLINRINHNVFSRGLMKEHQFGFRPQNTIDAAMAIKTFVQEGLAAKEVITLVWTSKALSTRLSGRDTQGTEAMWMSQEPLRTYELLFPPHNDPVNEFPKHGERNKQRMLARILLGPRFLELKNITRYWN